MSMSDAFAVQIQCSDVVRIKSSDLDVASLK